MTTADEVAGGRAYEREREDADRRYNDALTALDRAIVAAQSKGTLEPDGFARVNTALIVFLQQITAFVDTKNRALVAGLRDQLAALERRLEPMAELRTQMTVVQRAVQSVVSRQSAVGSPGSTSVSRQSPVVGQQSPVISQQSPVISQQSPVISQQSPVISRDERSPAGDYRYVAFEDEFRGSPDAIAEKLRAYVPILAGADKSAVVVDLGCGRGELLTMLKAAGVHGRGIDANRDMVAAARSRGLDVNEGDALTFLESMRDRSLGGVVATQLVEHLEPSYLLALIDAAARKLRDRAPIVIETINPACWLAFFSSYIRDMTHVRPVHPETLQYLLRAHGFQRVEVRYSAPVPDHMKMKTIVLPPDVASLTDPAAMALAAIAHTMNANAVILNNLMFTHLDYAAIGYR